MVGRLLDHVEALEARISELAGRPKPPTEPPTEGGKERKPPSWVKANRPDLPRKERQKRAHGFARRREEPTHRVEHATASCPDCGTLLLGGRVRRRRQIITIPRVRARVTEHVVLERTCRKCGQQWSPELDWGALAVRRQRVGISVQQEVCVLREECRLPYGVIQRYLKWRYRLGLSVGELVGLGAWSGPAGPGGVPPATAGDSSQSGGVWGRDRRAGRWPERVSLELQHSGGALLPPPGQPGPGGGCAGVGR